MSSYFPRFLFIVCLSFFYIPTIAQPVAFPGAEGFGANTPGGRGGQVIEVTNLNDSGIGSFRAACEASGPRIVVFRIGGTITLESTVKIEDSYITIAGQSAPGGGICLRTLNDESCLSIKTHDVVVRYLRIRPGTGVTPEGSDTKDALLIKSEDAHDIVIDHCSITWGVDETASTYSADADKKVNNITYQWNIIGDALDCNTHIEGCHSKGLLLQHAEKISLHHNLFANNGARSPMILSGEIDMVNNIIYNWGGSAVKIENRYGDVFLNFIENYIAPGADSDMTENGIQVKTPGINLYLENNIAEHVRPDDSYPEDAIVNYREPATLVSSPFQYPGITTTSATQAYDDVLDGVGATLPARDVADEGTVNGVRDRTGRIIDYPSDVGGYPFLEAGTAPPDNDSDGMPNDWELSIGLDPNDASDGSGDRNGDGYTNVEEYLNSLVNPPTTPIDCNGDEGGTAYIDDCDICVGGNTGIDPCVVASGVTIDNCPSNSLNLKAVYRLSTTVNPSNTTDKTLTWASSDTLVAIVNEKGRVSAVGIGDVIITASTNNGEFTDSCNISVVPIDVGGIEITNCLQTDMEQNTTYRLFTSITPSNASNRQVIWGSSDSLVATVNTKGKVSAIAPGNVTITATTVDGGFMASCTISVVPVSVTGIVINNCPQTEIEPKTTFKLLTSVMPSNATNREVIWSSSDPLVATVNLKGKVSALAPGNVAITATTSDGGFSASCIISVVPVSVAGIAINNCPQAALTPKSRYKLLTDITPANASNENIIWSSTDPQVAIVNTKGRISTIGVGSAVIMAETEDGGFTVSCSIEVVPVNVTGITINNCPSSMLKQDTTYKLLTDIEPLNSTNAVVIWSSSNPQVAAVNARGRVSTLEPGSTIITATTDDGGFSDFCDISIATQAATTEQILTGETTQSDDIKLYLNTANPELLTIESTVNEFRFSLHSTTTGEMVLTKQLNEKTSYVDVSSLPEGLYLVQIHYPEGHYSTYKVMIR